MGNGLSKKYKRYKDLPVNPLDIKWGWNYYIDEFFHNNSSLWTRRKEPYIYYKHLFRKFLRRLVDTSAQVAEVEGWCCGKKPHDSTVRSSLYQDPGQWKLKKSEITEAIIFLNRNMDRTLQQKLQTRIKAKINQGYTTGDVARHCLVHESIIHKIQIGRKVPYQALKLIEDELL